MHPSKRGLYVPSWLHPLSPLERQYRALERERLTCDMSDLFREAHDRSTFNEALDIARFLAPNVEEARCLVLLFNEAPKTRREVSMILEAVSRVAPSSTVWYYHWLQIHDKRSLHNAAALGHDLAKVYIDNDTTFDTLVHSNARGYLYSMWLEDHSLTRYLYHAVALGDTHAMREYANNRADLLERMIWHARSFRDFESGFRVGLSDAAEDPTCRLVLGYMFHVNHCIFGAMCRSDDTFKLADELRSEYVALIAFIRAACNTWSMAARRLGLCRDLRVLVGQYVWSYPVVV